MDGGIGDLLNVFLNNPEMMKKATDLLSRLSASDTAPQPEESSQAAVPVMAAAEPPQSVPPAEKNPIGNLSSAPPEGFDQLASMVSSVMSALGMNTGAATQNASPAETSPPTSAEPTTEQENPAPPSQNGNGAATASAGNFDIERALGVLKNVSAETSPQKDNRIQLLLSLKPFMKDGRKQKIDMAVKYLNAAKVFNMFGKNGFI